MLDHMTTAHFKAFGYLVLKGFFSAEEVSQLRNEADMAVSSAYGAAYQDLDIDVGVQPAFDVPTMSAATPFAAQLVADDMRLWQASHYLLGRATIPSNAEATCFLANARWHADLEGRVTGVKFMSYLEPCSAEDGQLQVLPGSHRPDAGAAFWEYIRQDPRRQGFLDEPDEWQVPSVGLNTQPGDVIAFNVNLLHSSVGGSRRLAWAIYYFADPVLEHADQWNTTRDAILHIGNYQTRAFDHHKWPVWRDWAAAEPRSDARTAAWNRLRRVGVTAVEGFDIGVPKWQPSLPDQSAIWSSGAPPRRRQAS